MGSPKITDTVHLPEDAVKASFPHNIKPMLCTLVPNAFDSEEWIFELKWDGFRAIAEVNEGKVKLYSARMGVSYREKFPAVIDSLQKFEFNAVLDGEVIAFNQHGNREFKLVESYPAKPADIRFLVFDILYYNGYDLKDVSLIDRKLFLKEILPESSVILYCDHIEERGTGLLQEAKRLDFEGIIMKKKSSRYKQGERGDDWLKVKFVNTTEAIIIGYTPPQKAKLFGSLVLGIFNEDRLEYFGHAWHMPEDFKRELYNRMKSIETDIPVVSEVPEKNIRRGICWIKPELVCEVRYREITRSGKLRQPVFLRMRDEMPPEQVQREKSEPEKLVLPSDRNESEASVEGKIIKFHQLKRTWFPELGLRKEDVLEYYSKIAPYILPFLKDRPISFKLNFEGIYDKHRFKQSVFSLSKVWKGKLPDWLETYPLFTKKYKKQVPFILCPDQAHLLFFVEMGCIEVNSWISRITAPDNPDYCVIDLDPEQVGFNYVVEVALAAKEILDKHKIPAFVKTSGATGLHILIPLGAKYDYHKSRDFALLICRLIHQAVPELTTMEKLITNRKRKVYLDYLQNNRSDSLAAPYSLRPRKEATVSCPLNWEEVKEGLSPLQFDYKTIFKYTDRWKRFYEGIMGEGIIL